MKCKICKDTAVVALRSHNTAFCAKCYLEFFSRQVSRAIESQHLFTHTEKILVALSGGKDSLSLMLELAKQGYNVTGLHIDLAIPDSSAPARAKVEQFCQKHNLKLIVVEMAKEGLAIPLVRQYVRRPTCSVCGKIKRHYFNAAALKGEFDVLATGHNLNDEVARLFSNVLRWDQSYLADQGPYLASHDGFARKVRPLWRLTEFETACYAFIQGIDWHFAACPYSPGASFSVLKNLLLQLETVMPGRRLDFYQGFLQRGKPVFQAQQKMQKSNLQACVNCGYPTSADALCSICRIRNLLKEAQEKKQKVIVDLD